MIPCSSCYTQARDLSNSYPIPFNPPTLSSRRLKAFHSGRRACCLQPASPSVLGTVSHRRRQAFRCEVASRAHVTSRTPLQCVSWPSKMQAQPNSPSPKKTARPSLHVVSPLHYSPRLLQTTPAAVSKDLGAADPAWSRIFNAWAMSGDALHITVAVKAHARLDSAVAVSPAGNWLPFFFCQRVCDSVRRQALLLDAPFAVFPRMRCLPPQRPA